MKRGLKALFVFAKTKTIKKVALITPMKRGLKENRQNRVKQLNNCCTNYPDEKGTERLALDLSAVLIPLLH